MDYDCNEYLYEQSMQRLYSYNCNITLQLIIKLVFIKKNLIESYGTNHLFFEEAYFVVVWGQWNLQIKSRTLLSITQGH